MNRKAEKQAVCLWSIIDWFTISQVISGIRIIISALAFWVTTRIISVQSQRSEETTVICSVTSKERLTCSILGVSV